MFRKAILGCAAVLFAATLALAGTEGRWLHVQVLEQEKGGDNVHLNLPLGVVAQVLPAIGAEHFQDGRLKIGDADQALDLRKMWQALRDSDDGEYVNVQGDDERVHVAKQNGFMVVHVQDDGDDAERVEVRLPIPVVEALFSGAEGELNVGAALEALGEYDGLDLIRVKDEDSTVRIWVDSTQGGPAAAADEQ